MSGVTRALLEDYLSWMASSPWATTTRSHHAHHAARLPRLGPPLRPAARLARQSRALRRRGGRPEDRAAPVRARVRHGPARVRGQPGPAAAPQCPQPRRLADGDRAARRRRLPARLQPPHRRQRRLALPALLQLQGRHRAAHPAQRQGGRRPSGPSRPTSRARWPDGSPWLFPGIADNADGSLPYAHGSLSRQLGSWQARIGVHDESGHPVRIHAHQFRHTVGTRLINAGVPQHVVQKLLGHASPRMTARYATIHDHTVRDAFEEFCRQRVNTAGEHLDFEPDALTADAEWVKHNLSRVRDSLPNGYCGRPPQQDCPHPNACLTCPDFQTTPEFLDDPPQTGRHQPAPDRPSRRRRPVPPGRQPPPGPGQPRAHHPRPRSDRVARDREGRSTMTRADNTAHLRLAAAARHDAAVGRARSALEALDRSGHSLTFSAVALAAGVSRGWLYNQPDLRSTITRLRTGSSRSTPPVPAAQRATPDSVLRRLDAARDEVTRLRSENAVLRDQLARSLGDQRANR